ncbi:MAG: hypothetical protein J7L14_03280 [Candidatus Diapherotrites archaeon]|nr:hypothetical protein [Candidatus Diapherotrites archaeon]
MEPEIIKFIPEGKASIEKDVFEKLAKENKLAGIKLTIPWLPVDSMEKLRKAEEEWSKIACL